ncbi:DNA polymerase III subunit epsilon [Candidatus Cyrtobacter comes]|uniref:DNA polymerase III subunit epsilon n=1 Tax=Candidatus Cyrtobacter comes TaxID=675776 RepID=A0ABU5L8U4_9RICK|nr:DNA polymerase III subunit epsilon [Candidatus Cyrtobacter comes]MDZ5762538.1 DNA polymerase III subunit epsilon [Candidatus Cyrtobacter comes]
MREIVLDTETTGLSVRDGHRIIEIGCVELIDRRFTGRVFHEYINPKRDIEATAFLVHGISNEFLKNRPQFQHIVNKLLDFVQDSSLIMHNANFDVSFLNNELSLCGKRPIDRNKIVDTLTIARRRYPGSKVSLDALCRRMNINLSSREKHGALIDAKLLASVYAQMVSNIQSSILFSNEKRESIDLKSVYKKRSFQPTELEVSEHFKALEYIKKER